MPLPVQSTRKIPLTEDFRKTNGSELLPIENHAKKLVVRIRLVS